MSCRCREATLVRTRSGLRLAELSPTEFFVPMFGGTASFLADDSGRIRRLVANIQGRSITLERVEE